MLFVVLFNKYFDDKFKIGG